MSAPRNHDRALVPVKAAQPPAPVTVHGQAVDAVGDLKQAWRTVQVLGDHDISATLQTAVVCTGLSQLEALEAVLALVRQSPRAQIHSIAWARSPGPDLETWQYQATLLLSYPDGRGETTGVTHQADSRPGRT